MPAWLLRLLYRIRGRRLVRLHLEDPAPSFEGILVGRWSGHYVLLKPRMVEAEDRTHSLDGVAEVPQERVIFVQVLERGSR